MIDLPPEVIGMILACLDLTPEDLLSLARVSRLLNTFALREFFVGRALPYGDVDTPPWLSYPGSAPWVKVKPEGSALVFRALSIALDVKWCEGIDAACSDVREIEIVTKLIARLAIGGIILKTTVLSSDLLDKIGALVVVASRYPLRRLSIYLPDKGSYMHELEVISEGRLASIAPRKDGLQSTSGVFHTEPDYDSSEASSRYRMRPEKSRLFEGLHPLTTLTEVSFNSPIMLMPSTARWLINSMSASSIHTLELGSTAATQERCCWNHVLQYITLPQLKILKLHLKVDPHGIYADFISRHPNIMDLSIGDYDLSHLRLDPDTLSQLSVLRGYPGALLGFMSSHDLKHITQVEIYVVFRSFRECLTQLAKLTFNRGVKLKLSYRMVHQAVSLWTPSRLTPERHVPAVTALEVVANRDVVSSFDVSRLCRKVHFLVAMTPRLRVD